MRQWTYLFLAGLILFCSQSFAAETKKAPAPKVKVENVKVQIFEKGKDPVTVTVPYWVAKAGSEISDMIKIEDKNVDMKKILNAIENAPQLGTIMTIEEKEKKVIISIE